MSTLKSNRNLLIGLGALLVVGLVLVVSLMQAVPARLNGSVIHPAAPAPEIALQDQFGHPFRLSDMNGSVVLVFFGYTNCPDVCPTTLVDYAQIFDRLGSKADGARFVFVTVDPARDSPEAIENYLGAFNPDFIGLTGSHEALQAVYESYGVSVEIEHSSASHGYEVGHQTRIYVIDRDGMLVETFPFGLPREAMLDDLLHWIE